MHAVLKLKGWLPLLFPFLFWASFHPLNFGFLAWICLVPLILHARLTSGRKAFFVAWLGGAVAFAGCFFWVRYTVPPAPYLLGLYMGLYPALFVAFIRRSGPLWAPVVWVALEYVRGHLFSGLPWFLLGYTQHDAFHLIQIADLGGVWLVSALVAFVNGAIVDPRRGAKLAAAAAVVAAAIYGAIRAPSIAIVEGPKIAVVQPNIPQDLKILSKEDPEQAFQNYLKHLALTIRAAEQKPDLIVWPEAAIYRGVWWSPEEGWLESTWLPRALAPSKETGIPTLIGALVIEQKSESFTNSALLIVRDKGIVERYDKVHLVPFAEYIPLADWFPFIRTLIRKVSGVTLDSARPGKGFPIWNLGPHRYGVQICFEAIFPEISREIARNGASFTVNISNDGWFRDSGELDQMLAMARFRAIENRMHVIRATNTGISAFIEPTGRLQSVLERPDGRRKEIDGTLVERVKVTPASSLYRAWGDWIVWLALAGTAAGVLRFIFVDRKKRTA